MFVVKFIKSNNAETTRKEWEIDARGLVEYSGVHSLSLYKVVGGIKKDVFPEYQFVSIIEFENREAYEKVQKEKHGIELLNEGATLCQTYHFEKTMQLDTKNVLLINPFEIGEDQIESLLVLWYEICKVMVKKEGFIGVNFLKASEPQSKFKFINLAEWRSIDKFREAIQSFEHTQFRERISQYKGHPTVCEHVETIRRNSLAEV